MNTHKMGCMNNAVCAVYHADGKCPGYNIGCTCGADSKTTHNNSWEEEFDRRYNDWNAEDTLVNTNTRWPESKYEPDEYKIKDFIRTTITSAEKRKVAEIRDGLVKHLVDRFLGWKLPEHLHFDNGISFIPTQHQLGKNAKGHWPRGTNLLDATQAKEMMEYLLEGSLLQADNEK